MAPSQAVYLSAQCPGGFSQVAGKLIVRVLAPNQEPLQALKPLAFAPRRLLVLQPAHDVVEHGECPAALVRALRRECVGQFVDVAAVRGVLVDRKHEHTTTTLLGAYAPTLVG